MSASVNAPLSRRSILQCLSMVAAAAGLPLQLNAADSALAAEWRLPDLRPVSAPGYGTDPNLTQPVAEPWPLTLDDGQLELLSQLADILIPAEGESPSATEAGVPAVVDHWVSAPYPDQHAHRQQVLAGLDWLQREAGQRFGCAFVELDESAKLQIVDDIAFGETPGRPDLAGPVAFFDLLRRLVAGAFYATEEGGRELGYVGNVPVIGDYPGPTPEAMAHLNKQLKLLGLEGD